MGNLDWDFKNAKSFGNGILRITIKDLIIVIMALVGGIVGWKDIKSSIKSNTEKLGGLTGQVSEIQAEIQDTKDRVLVLETITKSTRNSVNQIKNEEIFDSDVSTIKKRKQ